VSTGAERERAAELHAAGVAANAQMRPLVAGRHLRAALAALAGPGSDDQSTTELRGRILVTLALSESERGEVEAGLQLLAEAEPLLPPAERGALHGQRGILLRRTGRDQLAVDAYAQALTLLSEDRQPEEVARVMLNRAVMHLAAVRLGPARSDLAACLRLADQHDLPRLATKARHNLGYVDFLAGNLPAALLAYRRAAEEYAHHAPGMLPVLSLDRARCLLAAGLFTEADLELQRAIRRLGGQRISQDLAEAHASRAEAALLAERLETARRHAARAHELFVRRDNPRWAARARLLQLRADQQAGGRRADHLVVEASASEQELRDLGLGEDARVAGIVAARALLREQDGGRAAVERLAACRPRGGDRLDTRLLWRLAMAEASLAAGRHRVARRHLALGLGALEDQRNRVGALDLRTGAGVHGRALAQLGLTSAVRDGGLAQVFAWSERARAQALLVPPVRPPADPEVATWVEELRGVDTALIQGEAEGGPVAGLRARREELRHRLREHSWFTAGPGSPVRRIGLSRVDAELEDAAMLVYLPIGRRLLALVLGGGRGQLVDLGTESAVAGHLRLLRADLDVAAGRQLPERLASAVASASARNAEVVADLVLGPVLPHVGDRELVIVPTGALFGVPWPVLTPTRGRPLTVALSATSWSRSRARRMRALGEATSAAVVAGPRIGYGEREVAEVSGQLVRAGLLVREPATTEATLSALGEVNVAHVAAHGHHSVDNALFSGLELTDGMLMGYDVEGLARAPQLVVLSACDVGRHHVRPGDESLGMATAFLAAGTGTVVASVCRIADAVAPTVMGALYASLSSGRSPAAALAEASSHNTGFVCFGAG